MTVIQLELALGIWILRLVEVFSPTKYIHPGGRAWETVATDGPVAKTVICMSQVKMQPVTPMYELTRPFAPSTFY